MLVKSFLILGILTPVWGFSFFCTQFRPLKIKINETTSPGSVLKRLNPPNDKLSSVKLLFGDKSYINYNLQTSQVKLIKSARNRRGETLVIKGDCTDYLEPYKYLLNVSISIEIEVIDVNDAPQFVNLPSTTTVLENVTIGDYIFTIKADNPEDVYPEFRKNKFTLLSIGSVDKPQLPLDNWFGVEVADGRVKLKHGLDYEDGPRQIRIVFKVEDHGIPPRRNVSTLTIEVDDVDDLGPKFTRDVVSFAIIGEKPINNKECSPTSPQLAAEDQDGKLKSPLAYRLVHGNSTNNWLDSFDINKATGEICQLKTVKFVQSKRGDQTVQEGPGEFNLTVQAYQIDNPDKCATATIAVSMQNVNQYKPTFERQSYGIQLKEYPELQKNSVIFNVTAVDHDYGRNGELEYRLSSNPENGFSIHPQTGEIFIDKPEIIDRERNATIELKVQAIETKSYELYVSEHDAEVIIHIVDVNDNSPIFTESVYNFTVKDNHPVGTPIHQFEDRITVQDLDQEENGEVRLAIVSVQNTLGMFSLNDFQRFRVNDNGVIVIQNSLQSLRRQESLPVYVIIVQARDQCEDDKLQRSNTAQVYIRILEANEHAPIFEKKHYKLFISEAAPIGTLITEIKATDDDGDEDIYVTYTITSGNEDDMFRISEKGFLFTNKQLDRETRALYNLTIVAFDGVHKVQTVVTIKVKDTNDNNPVFETSIFDFRIPENKSSPYHIGSIGARDKDDGPNGQLVYTLLGEHADVFFVSNNGDLSVQEDSAVFDREETDVLILQVHVEDLGQPPQKEEAMVRIYLKDINDEPPVFTRNQYHIKIPEPDSNIEFQLDTQIVTDDIIGIEDADTDSDNRDTIFVLHGDGNELFRINNKTGQLFIKNTSLIDSEVKSEFRLQISAFDGTFTTNVPLVLEIEDRNDNSPRFIENMNYKIDPLSPIGSLVGRLVATDDDISEQNNHMVYLLQGGSLDKFSVDSLTGEIRVIDDLTKSPYRRQYLLNVRVVDFGQPQLSDHSVAIINVPINQAPEVPKQHIFRINESFPVSYIVGQISVEDPDGGKLLYIMSENDDTLPFYMENQDGRIYLGSSLDTEVRDVYSFQVEVVNLGYPNLTLVTNVIIYVEDVNDEAPHFSSWFYTSEIIETINTDVSDEPLKLSPELSVVDEDARDGDHVVYDLRGKGADDFIIDSRTGVISRNPIFTIDCERQCEYILQIVARDENGAGLEGTTDLQIKVVDINDNQPILASKNLTLEIEPALSIGSTIAHIDATDADFTDVNKLLTFTLVDGGDGKFFVHPSAGDITLSNSLLQEPIRQEYQMTVMVTDSGQPPLSASTLVTVYIPINLPLAVVPQLQLNVSEDESPGKNLWTFDRHFSTDNISFVLKTPTDLFKINNESGDLVLMDTLDAETQQTFTLIVLTVDHGEPTYTMTTTVTINVLDINDNKPKFSTQSYQSQISENNNPTALNMLDLVPPLEVHDSDVTSDLTNTTYSLRGSGSDMFSIITGTGGIYVRDGEVLDCEDTCDYQFEIIATDYNGYGLSSSALLNIKVKDENDHIPEFVTNYTFTVKPSVPIGREIGTVQAIDLDTDPINHRLLFYLTGLGGYGKFQIEADTGTIYTTDSLLRAPVLEEYKIKVVAVDFGAPQLTGETTVTIKVPVHPIPDLPEQFEFKIPEDFHPGSFVGIVQLNTTDQIYFTLQSSSDQFSVDMVSGIIITTAPLDTEQQQFHKLPILITESRNGFYSLTATVLVQLEDVDDNFPRFSANNYNVFIKESFYNSSYELPVDPILDVLDGDLDIENQQYNLVLEGEMANHFYIDPSTNNIYTNNPTQLDREQLSEIHLRIIITSPNFPKKTSSANLTIFLEDVNDNAPKFESQTTFKSEPNIESGSVVAVVKATDLDATEPNNEIVYDLKSGGMDKLELNSETGELLLKGLFTEEPLKSQFDLIVVARDLGYPSQTATTSISILVPLNQPPTVPGKAVFVVEESIALGSLLPSLNISDVDSFNSLRIRLEDKLIPFILEDQRLRTTDVLNAEVQSKCEFYIITEDKGHPSYTMTTSVIINILDVNDNIPVFGELEYEGRIKEQGHSNHVKIVPAVTVIDTDTSSTASDLNFSLVGDDENMFQINPNTAEVKATRPSLLDCERRCVFDLKIQVTDDSGEGFNNSVPLKITLEDINDEAPTFGFLYSVHLNISTLVGREIVQVQATDRDREHPNNHIIYLMEDGQGKFSIDPNTGQIWLSHSLLEGETKDRYKLKVTAIDSGTPIQSGITEVDVTIVKNLPPTVNPVHTFEVKEDHPLNYLVGEITVENPDEDAQVTYYLNNTKVPFSIDGVTGELFTTRPLDREETDKFQFNVDIVDHGVPTYTVTTTVTVILYDVNDNPPKFLDGVYDIHILENQLVEKLSFLPNVSDDDSLEENRLFRFSLEDINDIFTVNEITGQISTRKPTTFDCEENKQFRLNLMVKDYGGLGSYQLVRIHIDDVNDEAPVIIYGFNFTVHPAAEPGDTVGEVIANDFDCTEKNTGLTYGVKEGGLGKFGIDPFTGVISVVESLLTPPYQDVYRLIVEVVDSGSPRLSTQSQVMIYVPTNKAPVVPEVLHFQLKENVNAPSVIGKLSADDADENTDSSKSISFHMQNKSLPFEVDEVTGFISVLEEFDSEQVDLFQFVVNVVNHGYPTQTVSSLVIVEIVDVNDNYPIFNSPAGYVAHVNEDSDYGSPTTSIFLNMPIHVSDKDSTQNNRNIKTRLIGSLLFDIDEDDPSVINVIKPGYLDAENVPVYTLLLEARDRGGTGLITSTNVTIYVKDINDHPPVFSQPENISLSYMTPVGKQIGSVSAVDPDQSEQNNQITYVLRDGAYGKFEVHPDSGIVYVSDDLSRDPCLEVFSLLILAVDNGIPKRTSNVTLHVTVPINKPPVLEPVINITVLENEIPATNVAQINIQDPDLILNKQESIEFYMDDVGAPFELDKYSGMLRTNGPIDRESVDRMTFMVRVVNDGAPPYTASTMVTVSVNDTNDNPPVFSSPTGYLAQIPENISWMTPGFLVPLNTEFNVIDEDMSEDNRNIQIKLVGKGADLFELIQGSKYMRLRQPSSLDCEIICKYELKLTATDQNGQGLSTSTNLTVELLDENDHSPRFLNNYTFTISPKSKLGYIGKVVAVDDDATTQNNQITYLLKSGGIGKFSVDSDTGEIIVISSLERHPKQDHYKLVVAGQDNGVPRRVTTTVVNIYVPLNHRPWMTVSKHEIVLSEDIPVGHKIVHIKAKDKDRHQELSYELKETTVPFSVHKKTGWLQVSAALDRERREFYTLHVMVHDNGKPVLTNTAVVKIRIEDVNDHFPVFNGGHFYQGFVNENMKNNRTPQVVQLERNISVTDGDATPTNRRVNLYLHGLGSQLFKLHPKTGQLKTSSIANIDREVHDFFHFKVVAVDNGMPAKTSTATILISVVDINDHQPKFLSPTFTFNVPDDIKPAGVIGRALAVDTDATQPNNLLLYLLEDEPSGKFRLDINTGTIHVSEGFFSQPLKPSYKFNVTARDLGFPAQITKTEVTLNMPNTNFTLRDIKKPEQNIMQLPEEIPIGTIIGRLDPELEFDVQNIQVDPSETESVPFFVKPNGAIVTTGRIDRELGKHFYNFKVLTLYNCTPAINTVRDVTAIVSDVNDNPPIFPLAQYTSTVSREFPTDTVVATPIAFDEVDERPSSYSYSLAGPPPEYVTINKTTGVVKTKDIIKDITAPQILSYTITARDNQNPTLIARTKLNLRVMPHNQTRDDCR